MKRNFLFWSLFFLFSASSMASASLVREVIDGEIIEMTDGERIRLIGIQTKPHPNQQVAGRDFTAADFLSQRHIHNMLHGKTVIIARDEAYARTRHQDRDGLSMAYVWYSAGNLNQILSGDTLDGSSFSTELRLLNRQLIDRGYAYLDESVKFSMRESFKKLQDRAKKRKRGVWGDVKIYDKSTLSQAKNAREASLTLAEERTRVMNLKKAEKLYTKLIRMVPSDYQLHYEKSWLRADIHNDNVTDENLEDIDHAIEYSPNNPKCYIQKHFLLRLQGRHHEAVEYYERAVRLAALLGMVAEVSYIAADLGGGIVFDAAQEIPEESWQRDQTRARFNDQHFLYFMARYRAAQKSKEKKLADRMYQEISNTPLFKIFLRQYRDVINRAPREILYETQWGQRGWQKPEEVLAGMERVDSKAEIPVKGVS